MKALPLATTALLVVASCKASESTEAPPPATTSDVKALSPVPPTKKTPVQDTFHKVTVSEDYRWLEDGSNAEVKAWSDAQNAHARSFLDNIQSRAVIEKRTREVLGAAITSYRGVSAVGSKVFAMKRQPPKQQPFLVVMDGFDKPESARVLFDPNEAKGTSVDWYVPSPSGKLVALSLSKGGTESGDVTIFDVATGKPVHEVIPRVNGGTAGGSLAWTLDEKGFYYTRYPRGTERPEEDKNFYQQLYFHKLGEPTEKDTYELGKDFPRIAEIQVAVEHSTGAVLVTTQKGDGGEFTLHYKDKKTKWTKFSEFGDKVLAAFFGPNKDLYLISRQDAPKGKVVRLLRKKLDLKAGQVVIPEGQDTVVEDFWGAPTIRVTEDRIYVEYQLGGPSEIRAFDHKGKRLPSPKAGEVSAVYSMGGLADGRIYFGSTSFLEPPAVFIFDPKTGKTTKTALATKSPMDVSNYEVRREMATSKDGTQIPVNILMKKGTPQDASAPLLLYGYGGYGVNLIPAFSVRNLLFLEQDYIYAVANIRGGGEFGEEWHRQGNLTNKQNVFDDFAAATQHMIDRKYTGKGKMGIMGGSNGGLLMGATMVQHPELAAAVVSFVGIYDMLRVELSPNGAFNIPEFGTVKDEAQFKALHAYSPYHNVKDEVAYPPTLFLTGENDPRVDPMQSRKMTARLQATATKAPVLLRTSKDTGHGGSTPLNERIARYADMYAFFAKHLKK